MTDQVYVVFDTGTTTALWPSFHPVPATPRLDRRHRIMSIADAAKMLGDLYGSMGARYESDEQLAASIRRQAETAAGGE